MNRQALRAVLTVACAALCGGLLASCGDADDAPGAAAVATSIDETVAATSKLDSARLTASLQLDPEGLLALGGPIALRASGPFAAGAKGELPRLELAVGGTLARKNLSARAISTGKRAYLQIDGRDYRIDQDFIDSLRSHDRSAASADGARKPHPGLASLGLDPSAWIKDPQDKGTAAVGGVPTQRIAGSIDVKRLLDDVAKLLGGDGGLLTPKLRAQIAAAVTSTKVDLWTGATTGSCASSSPSSTSPSRPARRRSQASTAAGSRCACASTTSTPRRSRRPLRRTRARSPISPARAASGRCCRASARAS